MTDPILNPREHRLDDPDVPRDPNDDVDEPLVNLDATPEEPSDDEAADKYIQVIDGRPETLGVEKQDPRVDQA